MKSFGFITLLFSILSVAHAELDTLWSRRVVLSPFNYSIDAATVLQSGDVMAAASRSDGGDVNLWRFDRNGEIEWTGTVTFPSFYVSLIGMKQYSDGQIALFAEYWSANGDSGYFFHVKRFSENGDVLGDDAYGMQMSDVMAGLASLSDNSILYYSYYFDGSGAAVPLLMKFNADGDTIWTRNTGPDAYSVYGRAVCELPGGDFLLGGGFAEENSLMQGFVMRATPDGVPVWSHEYPGTTNLGLSIYSVDVDNSGNIVAGGTDGNFWWFSRPWAIGLDLSGNVRWQCDNNESIEIGILGIRTTPEGGAVFCGSNFPDFGFVQSSVYSITPAGDPLFEMSLPTPSQFRGISNDGPRGSVMYGTVTDNNGANNGELIRFGPATVVQGFVRALQTNAPIEGVRVALVETGEFTMSDAQGIYNLPVSQSTGTLRLTSPCTTPLDETVTLIEGETNTRNFTLGLPQYDCPVTSINRVVTLDMWEHDTLTIYNDGTGALHFSTEAVQLSPVTYEWLRISPASGVIPANSSAEIVISIGASSQYPETELYGEARIHHNACPDTVSEIGIYTLALDVPDRPGIVDKFAMYAAYPNPFNAEARLDFDIPQTSQVTAKLYSVQGREAATLTNQVYSAGRHSLVIDGADLATGVYLLRVNAGSFSATQKIVLLK